MMKIPVRTVLNAWVISICTTLGCAPESVPQQFPREPVNDAAVASIDAQSASLDAQGETDGNAEMMDVGLSGMPDGDIRPMSECGTLNWSSSQRTFRLNCHDNEIGLLPGIHADGEWREPRACERMEDGIIQCHFFVIFI